MSLYTSTCFLHDEVPYIEPVREYVTYYTIPHSDVRYLQKDEAELRRKQYILQCVKKLQAAHKEHFQNNAYTVEDIDLNNVEQHIQRYKNGNTQTQLLHSMAQYAMKTPVQHHHECIDFYKLHFLNNDDIWDTEIVFTYEDLYESLDMHYRLLQISETVQAKVFGFTTMAHAMQHDFIRDMMTTDGVSQGLLYISMTNFINDTEVLKLSRTIFPHETERTLHYALRQRFAKIIHDNMVAHVGDTTLTNTPWEWAMATLDQEYIVEQLQHVFALFYTAHEQGDPIIELTPVQHVRRFNITETFDKALFQW